MELLQSIVIGVIQGITEFLPISSSAHLVLVPYLFGWQYKGLSFDVALHFGTVIAIVIYFAKDWIQIIKNGFTKNASTLPASGYQLPTNLLWQILLASLPAAIVGFLIADYVESYLHSPILLALNLIVFGLLLWLVDRFSKKVLKEGEIRYSHSLLVGFGQCLALVPGVSRSGITMIVSRGLGLPREQAARFSFLLGTPAMLGAFFFEARHLDNTDLNFPFFMAVLFSALAGAAAIKFLLAYLKKGSFLLFTIYRIVLAFIVLIFTLLG